MSGDILLTPGAVLGLPEKPVLGKDISQFQFTNWDTGVLQLELLAEKLVPHETLKLNDEEKQVLRDNPEGLSENFERNSEPSLSEGTYQGTQLALTEVFHLIEKKFSAVMDVKDYEPIIPFQATLEQRQNLYSFTNPDWEGNENDRYPPHLNLGGPQGGEQLEANVPKEQKRSVGGDIFNLGRLMQTATLITSIQPTTILGRIKLSSTKLAGNVFSPIKYGFTGTPDQGETIAEIEKYNTDRRGGTSRQDIFDRPNIGDSKDWYSDERFAQQHFTGTNPTTITLATDFWTRQFTAAAVKQDSGLAEFLKSIPRSSLYMQDYSYFREAVGIVDKSQIIKSRYVDYAEKKDKQEKYRYGCASVCLFRLDDNGKLLPLAIVIDWKGALDKSVTIFNKRILLQKAFHSEHNQRDDWPWRYAKTCIQVSDWTRHEIAIHLVNTHFVEETIIVAANRQLPQDHDVYRLLYPHWTKTLSLNAAARTTLVPGVVVDLIAFNADQAYDFIKHAYYNFDFQGLYVPADLKKRGFPPERLGEKKFCNYAYARCIHSMWLKIRSYVHDMLSLKYADDKAVEEDIYIKKWCQEVQSQEGGRIKTFPTIKTHDQLCDAVTMCIHIASPQHTAVNYLQSYYQSFVINKPPCLYTQPPGTLEQLQKFQEKDLVQALPINHTREWLLASHLPYLLTFKPGDKDSLISYAYSKFKLYIAKKGEKNQRICWAAAKFFNALLESADEFKTYSTDMDDDFETHKHDKDGGQGGYYVLDPTWNAVSILI